MQPRAAKLSQFSCRTSQNNAETRRSLRNAEFLDSEICPQTVSLGISGFLCESQRALRLCVDSLSPATEWLRLSEQSLHHLAAHIRQAEIAALKAIGQLGVINAQAVQHRGVEVMHADRVLRDVVAEIVSRAVN